MKNTRLTVLMDDTVRKHSLLAEHGLSFWIESDSQNILFDTGQTGLILKNADLLNIKLAAADKIVLSHGHYDHTGGLEAVLRKTGKIKIFAHPEALTAKYARDPDGTIRDIGLPARCGESLLSNADMVSTESPLEIGDGLFVTGPIPRVTDYEDVGGPYFKDAECAMPDNLIDDQSLFFDAPAGIILILGCAHAGIINILRYVSELVPRRPFHMIIGGTHLIAADKKRMNKTVDALREYDVKRLLPVHCTGFAAAARLWNEFPGRVSTCPAGTRVDLIE